MFIPLACQAPIRLGFHLHPGFTARYEVKVQGGGSNAKLPKGTHQTREETYKLQSIDKSGVLTFHTAFVVSGGSHGTTRGNGEQQLKPNAEPPGGLTSYIFDNTALSDLSFPPRPLSPGQTWQTGVSSFGKSNVGKLSYTYLAPANIDGIPCAKIAVSAGSRDASGISGGGTIWVSLKDGLPVKKSLVQHFGARWTTKIEVIRKR